MNLSWLTWDGREGALLFLLRFLKVKLQRSYNMLQTVEGFSQELLLDMKMNSGKEEMKMNYE